MPPYRAVTSKAQSRKLFALSREGKLSLDEAKGKTRAADWEDLPRHVRQNRTRSRSRSRPKRTSGRDRR